MLTYAVRKHFIPSQKYVLFNRLVHTFNAFPDFPEAETVSCHSVCRALTTLFEGQGLYTVDGYFSAKGHDHSWLDLGDGIVADMYPVAGGNSFIVDASHFMIPWNKLYIKDNSVLPLESDKLKRHEEIAQQLVNAYRKAGIQNPL